MSTYQAALLRKKEKKGKEELKEKHGKREKRKKNTASQSDLRVSQNQEKLST